MSLPCQGTTPHSGAELQGFPEDALRSAAADAIHFLSVCFLATELCLLLLIRISPLAVLFQGFLYVPHTLVNAPLIFKKRTEVGGGGRHPLFVGVLLCGRPRNRVQPQRDAHALVARWQQALVLQ